MESKFKNLTSYLLGEETNRQVIDMVINLDKLADIRALTKSIAIRRGT